MKWAEDSYTRDLVDEQGNPVSFDEYERRKHAAGRFQLTKGEVKLLGIAGAGFFLDSYDLFIINLVTPVWTYEYWGGLAVPKRTPHYPPLLRGLVNAGANIGNIIGQVSFGFLGDAFGRRFVYGKELIICIIGMIMVIALPNSIPTPTLKMIWVFCFRLFMGIGIGGDYPMSASIVSERAHLKRRGTLLGIIFSNQGWGTLAGSIVTIVVLACFEKTLNQHGNYGHLDAVWRIQMGVALVPALAVLWPRLKMPEGKQYLQSQELNSRGSSNTSLDTVTKEKGHNLEGEAGSGSDYVAPGAGILAPPPKDAQFTTFCKYFSEWRHLKLLIGTASTWFLVDVAFYGVNLNQSVILTEIGFSTGKNQYHKLMRNALGNLIIAVAGYVPGYFVTIALIERLGRKWIQIQGFLVCALLFAVLAGDYNHLGTAPKFVCFALAQFFFNFGPNATTFIYPAELFPSRVRGLAHGLSAAIGKLGAILSALLFNYLSSSVIGLPNVLWIFFACNLLGALITWFLLPESRARDADVIDYEEWLEANPGSVRSANNAVPLQSGSSQPI